MAPVRVGQTKIRDGETYVPSFIPTTRQVAWNEIDTRAESCVFGRNFRPTQYTDQVCNVHGFHPSSPPLLDVPIVTACTALDLEHETIILEIHQGLYLPELENSLINPNQIRAFGITLCDDPYDPYRALGFHDPLTDTFVPFQAEDTFIGWQSRPPTDHELATCRYVVLTSDQPWMGLSVEVDAVDRRCRVGPEQLAKRWNISLEQAQSTLKATTQENIRTPVSPLVRRFRTDLFPNVKRLNDTFYSDTLFSKHKSLNGNKCAQVFGSGDFIYVHPMRSKGDAGEALQFFHEDVGSPRKMIVDGANEQVGKNSDFYKRSRKCGTYLKQTEPYTPRQNLAENWIGRLKSRWRTRMTQQQINPRFWDYLLIYESELINRTAKPGKRTPYERITGETPDISEWLDFAFYDFVQFWDMPGDMANPSIGRWLGISHRIGTLLCYYVLKDNGEVVSRTTVQPAVDLTDEFKSQWTARLENAIASKPIDSPVHGIRCLQDLDEETSELIEPVQTHYDPATYDLLLGAELILDHNDSRQKGTVKRRKRDDTGGFVGNHNVNPVLDTSIYEVEFSDGITKEYAANTILENIVSTYYNDGYGESLFESIIAHRSLDDEHKQMELLVEWQGGGLPTWVPVLAMKHSFAVQTAEYAKANNLHTLPCFSWWVGYTLKKKDRIIAKIKTKYWTTNVKYGIRLPHSVKEALAIDAETGTDFWYKAIAKEMKNVRPAFQLRDDLTPQELSRDPKILPGFQKIHLHMIFDVKADLQRKARLVANGNETKALGPSSSYSSVVSRESVRIAFFIANLFQLQVLTADISNAYINAPCREKIWCIAGPEFGIEEEGKVMIIQRALYGLRTSGASWRAMLASSMADLGFRSCLADADVWIRRALDQRGNPYYEYALIYVDDILVISHEPVKIMDALQKIYTFKTCDEPTRYLGANVVKGNAADGVLTWGLSADDFVKNAVKNVETMLGEDKKLESRGQSVPWTSGYRPEIDVSPLLQPDEIQRYQHLIGTLRWMTELGRIDILHEVAKLSTFQAAPRQGHLDAAYKIFAYLKKHQRSRMLFDSFEVVPDSNLFSEYETWGDFYFEAEEAIPPNAPPPLGPPIRMSVFVDADHAGNLITRRSHTGILIYLNNAPVSWLSKQQTTVESSTFGSELNAMRIAVDMVQALRYKLRMMGLNVTIPADVYGDNNSVCTSVSTPESTLQKKHNAVCYHRVREAIAMKMIRVCWIDGKYNLADLFTKPLTADRRSALLSQVLY